MIIIKNVYTKTEKFTSQYSKKNWSSITKPVAQGKMCNRGMTNFNENESSKIA